MAASVAAVCRPCAFLAWRSSPANASTTDAIAEERRGGAFSSTLRCDPVEQSHREPAAVQGRASGGGGRLNAPS